MPRPSPRPPAGFTLVEMILAIVVFGVLASTATVFMRPMVTAYVDTFHRTALVDATDTALRRMQRDVQLAVPNSIRSPSSDCFEVVPTSAGGRFRTAADTITAGSAVLDTATATTAFDVLTPLASVPAAGDWVVVDNQNPSDVYTGANRAAVSAVSTPAAALGRHRIAVASTQFPLGYDGGRFVVVPDAQKAVFYVCGGADGTLDAAGNGRGTLVRLSNYGFNAAMPAACPAIGAGAVLATGVRSCRFVYDPNQGATQQNGFLSIQLELARHGETASLVLGAHVVNVP
ncbi:type II secretion system protein [Ideonella sp. A 288]|uniref:type II secretion system protein n=1 Tax=Ideonella sp. A 288 TaxID=1962181 RepID=UPI000B4B8CA7|nr:type II secretion system protein [Ideonella sp. A 288]